MSKKENTIGTGSIDIDSNTIRGFDQLQSVIVIIINMKLLSVSLILIGLVGLSLVLCDKDEKNNKKSRHHKNKGVRKLSSLEGELVGENSRRRSKNKKDRIGVSRLPVPAPATSPVVEAYTDIFQPPTTEYRQTQCKEIPQEFALCYDIGYNKMHLPNLRGHDSMDELLKQSNEWTPLLATRCHPEARKFLCSVFAPVCVRDFSKPIPPCRSLCEAVRDGCSPAMARFDFPWPHMLNCSQFPTDDTLCIPLETIKSSTPKEKPPAAKTCAPCRQKKMTSGFKKKICSFDFIMKARVRFVSYHKGSTKLFLERKSRSVFKWQDQLNTKSAGRKMAKKSTIWMRDGLNCTCDVLDGVHTNYLIAGWLEGSKLKLHSITKWRKSDKRISKLLKRKKCGVQNTKNKRSE